MDRMVMMMRVINMNHNDDQADDDRDYDGDIQDGNGDDDNVGHDDPNLSEQAVELSLGHEDTDIVEGPPQVVLVQLAVLVDVHQLEAVLVHLDLLVGEASLILALAWGS